MNKEDMITLSITAREALRVYALLSKANGAGSLDLYRELKRTFDPELKLSDKHLRDMPFIDYHLVQFKLEKDVFDKKTESEIQLEQVMSKLSELQTNAAELQKEAQRLQEIVAKENK